MRQHYSYTEQYTVNVADKRKKHAWLPYLPYRHLLYNQVCICTVNCTSLTSTTVSEMLINSVLKIIIGLSIIDTSKWTVIQFFMDFCSSCSWSARAQEITRITHRWFTLWDATRLQTKWSWFARWRLKHGVRHGQKFGRANTEYIVYNNYNSL